MSNVAKPDGLTLGMVQYNIYMDQLVGRKEVQFDVRKFVWIGWPAVSWAAHAGDAGHSAGTDQEFTILRDPYARALTDPELLAEAEKKKMDVDPSSGDELEDLMKKVMDQPENVIVRVKKMLDN